MTDNTFSKLSDDVTLKIFFLLEDDPRHWARLSCVCKKFSSLISTVCCRSKCLSFLPSVSSDLLSVSSSDGWASLLKNAVCCPGLLHAGVLLDNFDFGLGREIGATEDYLQLETLIQTKSETETNMISNSLLSSSTSEPTVKGDDGIQTQIVTDINSNEIDDGNNPECGGWSLYDDLYFDTIYDNSDSTTPMEITTGVANLDSEFIVTNNENNETAKRRKVWRPQRSHLASGVWNLSREQGSKLLASRFRDDCLYISEWPGCVHIDDKRNYMLFRGVFKNFKRTRVWRTINDGNRSSIHLNCAFCSCKETWDLHSAFCLKRGFGFHDDGEPVVRAYVCENGHVSGAWTDLPLYT
ncbi:phytochrome A-associated F-box protein-like [Chenopodium quinoa]|uniref:Phytochrome A-associated F-box protein n=1 Tax=Chenopodium quinoa TaxID=63459 RepID=A0A803MPD4_CHEQI|nr:phytochrome A-associated F-box protein-like [Chenopodium quinoa]